MRAVSAAVKKKKHLYCCRVGTSSWDKFELYGSILIFFANMNESKVSSLRECIYMYYVGFSTRYVPTGRRATECHHQVCGRAGGRTDGGPVPEKRLLSLLLLLLLRSFFS